MRRKRILISCLLPAYILLVLHAVIPHHHHFSAEEGPLSFHHGFNTHHHDHQTVDKDHDSDGHGHTAHFVHSPEFGTAMVRPGVIWIDMSSESGFTILNHDAFLTDRNITNDNVRIRYPETPPLYLPPVASTHALRGPPSLSIA